MKLLTKIDMNVIFALNRTVLVLAVLLSAIQCRSFDATAPDGFAVYDDGWSSTAFKAITSDGIRYLVREVENKPEGDDALW
ncbi:MAG: hypothetical protein H3C43_13430, partial [Leptonema sp. (in: Bacteria)]|nr:hypothetical protein [Leptonema sp. (in: bacteria)]